MDPPPPSGRPRPTVRAALSEGDAWIVLAVACAFAVFLILDETTSNTLFNDELEIFQRFGQGIDLRAILEPHNGHLIVPAHLVYAAVFEWVGPSYTALRVIGVALLVACALAFFQLVRLRVGAVLALAPTVLLLFFGSAWEALLWPLTMLTFVLSLTFGLGALLALGQGDRRGDLGACALATLAAISHSTGLAFLVGIGVDVLLRKDRRSRAWVFAVPLAIYAAWWFWALQFHEHLGAARNLLLVPAFVAESLAAVMSALVGVGIDLGPGPTNLASTSIWGPPLALLAVVGLVVRLRRGPVPRSLWVALAVALAYWAALALSFEPGRGPEASRFLFPGAVLLFVVAAEAVAGLRLPRFAVIAIFAVAVMGVLTNIRQLDDAEKYFRDYAARTRAALGAIEIGRDSVSPGFRPELEPRLRESVPQHFPAQAGPYLEAADRFGSSAFSPDELAGQPPGVRGDADRVLAVAERLSVQSAVGRGALSCPTTAAHAERAVRPVRSGRVLLEASEPARVRLGRFAPGLPVAAGRLSPRRPFTLSLPPDADPRPWRVALETAAPARLCIR
ncbi:MAG TPA: hypothetical protein VKG89_01805 [Solirubrobacterales bacterium]|nr:hypothetical protein [Solirubrobacterales bacterium]